MTTQKNVLVTGGAGLIGSHLVDLLLVQGHQVTILDNLDPDTHPNGKPSWLPTEAKFIQGDIRNELDWQKALQGIDWVFHQAAFGGFTTNWSHYIDANATGTARLFQTIRDEGINVEKIVVASSQAIYGEGAYRCEAHGIQYPPMREEKRLAVGSWELPCPACGKDMQAALTPENAPKNGETAYALSKLLEERLALSFGKQLGIPTVALRYAVTYGPRQSIFNPYTGVVSIFSTRLLNDKAPVLYEDGRQTRDFLYVADNALANLFVMTNPETAYQAYNVGTGRPVSIELLVKLLAKAYRKDIEPSGCGHYRPGDARHFVQDASALCSLGWQPKVTLEEGLNRYVEWIQTQTTVEDYFERAFERLSRLRVVVHR